MAKYNPNITVQEALAPFLDSLEQGKMTGKLIISSTTSKRSGALFVAEGLVYAVQVKNYPSRMYTRLLNTGTLREDHVEDIQRRFERDQGNPQVISYATRLMMLSEQIAQSLLWEYNLGAWDDLFTWLGVKVEWKDGPTTTDATFWPHRNTLRKLVDLGILRQGAIEEIAHNYTLEVSNLPRLSYRTTNEAYEGSNYEQMALVYGTGDFSAEDLVRETGINLHDAISTIYDLWEKDVVMVRYEGFPVSRRNIELMKNDPLSYGEAQPLIHAEHTSSDAEREQEEQAVLSDEEIFNMLDEPEVRPEPLPEEDHEAREAEQDVPMPEADLDYVDTLNPDDEQYQDEIDEQTQIAEIDLVDTEEEEDMTPLTTAPSDELDALPLADEDPEVQMLPVEDVDSIDVIEAVVIESTPDAIDSDDDFSHLFDRIRQKMSELRNSTEEAAENMRACDEATETDSATVVRLELEASELQARLAELTTEATEARARIAENEATRGQWEAVYDESAARYHKLQAQLSAL